LERVSIGCDGVNETLPINGQTVAILDSDAAVRCNPVTKGKKAVALRVVFDDELLEVHDVSDAHQVPSNSGEGIRDLVVEESEVDGEGGHGNTALGVGGREHAFFAWLALGLACVVLELTGVACSTDTANAFGLEAAELASRAEFALLAKGKLANHANRPSKHTCGAIFGTRFRGSVTIVAFRASGTGLHTLEGTRSTVFAGSTSFAFLELACGAVKALPLASRGVE
jgi:hypothetical protein